MVKRTYTTEEAGTSSTNRFVQRNYIPTKVVTGATTTPAKVQPNLTGKSRLPVPATDGDSQTGVDPTPINYAALNEIELANVAKSGFKGGFFSPGSLAVKAFGAALGPAGSALVTAGTAANIYNARQEIHARTERDKDFDFLNPGKELQDRQRNINQIRKDALEWDLKLPSLPDLRDAKNAEFGKGGNAQEGTPPGDPGGSDNLDDPKIICTMMNRMYGLGEYRIKQWLLYSNRYLKEEHQLGYHKLYCKLVSLMPSNKLIAKILSHIADKRTDDIVAEMKGTKRNWLGRLYRLTLIDKPSYLVGICIKRNWIKPVDISVLNLGRI